MKDGQIEEFYMWERTLYEIILFLFSISLLESAEI
jgi:hypothetical protein